MTPPALFRRFLLLLCLLGLAAGFGACSDSDIHTSPPPTDGDTAENESQDGDNTLEDDTALESEGESEDARAMPFVPPPHPSPLPDEPFLQEYNHTTNEVPPELAVMNGVVFSKGLAGLDDFTPLTPRGIARHKTATTLEVVSIPEADSKDLRFAAVAFERLWLASEALVYSFDGSTATLKSAWTAAEGTTILGLSKVGTALFLFTDHGYWRMDKGSVVPTDLTAYAEGQTPVQSALLLGDNDAFAAYAAGETLLVMSAANEGLNGPKESLAVKLSPGVGPIRALLRDLTLPKTLELVVVGESGLKAYRALPSNGANPAGVVLSEIEVPEFAAGRVPYLQATSAARASDGGLIVGTQLGAMRLMNRGDGMEWRVYNAERWLPAPEVRAVASDPDTADSPIWFATTKGPGIVTAKRMTLEEKYAAFIERIATRHDRDGALADSHLTKKGDLSTNIPWDSDNDGSWTSYYLISECLRYSLTKDATAKAHFDRALEAMLRLRDETGLDYFVARSVIRIEGCQLDDCDKPDDGRWFKSPDGQWWVKTDTSNDEVIAHIFLMDYAYSVCGDEAQKTRIRAHVSGIVGGIVEHGYTLIDETGEITTYGQFDPWYVNVSPGGKWGDGGRRAAEMIAMLNVASYMTGEARFQTAKDFLINEKNYANEIKTDAIRTQRNNVYDMDEMMAESLLPLIRYEKDPALLATLKEGNDSSWTHLKELQMAWYSVVDYAMGYSNADLPALRRWLRLVPVDMIRWDVTNSNRQDLIDAPIYFRTNSLSGSDRQLGKKRSDGFIIPGDERRCDRYNTDQFRVDGGMGAMVEMDGAEALLAYWMARYYGILVPKTAR